MRTRYPVSVRRIQQAIDDYRAKINPSKEQDPEFVARINGLSDVQQFVRVHHVSLAGRRPGKSPRPSWRSSIR